MNSNKPRPPVIYKFLSAPFAMQLLESKLMKISEIDSLNDMFDCVPLFQSVPSGYLLDEKTEDIQDYISSKFGILCFSCSFRSPLLWGHYANSYTGVAIGFRTELLAPDGFYVEYERQRSAIDWPAYERGDSGVEQQQALQRIYSTKAAEWSYEEEYRDIIELDSFNDLILRGGMYFRKVPSNSIAEVILGPRCEISNFYMKRYLRLLNMTQTCSAQRAYASQNTYEIIAGHI